MGRGLLCSVALMVALVGPAGAALAVPVQWPVSEGGNGHYYEFIGQNFLRWEPARSAASARSFAGLPGYLATITTDAERLFVYERTTFTTDTGSDAWLGGFQAQDSPTAADGWSWVTGEPWDQTFWGAGEPFDGFPAGPDANFANHLSLFGRLREADQLGRWNDEHGVGSDPIGPIGGYFVEYSVVPEPAAAALFTVALGFLAWRRRR